MTLFPTAINWHSCIALQKSLFPYCSDLKPLQICFVQPFDCGSGSAFGVLLYIYLLKLILVLVHYEASEVNPCKEIRGERSQCKGLKFPELCMWLFIAFENHLLGVCLQRSLSELLLLNTTVSCLATTEAGMGGSQQTILEGVGLCHRILCPLLGGLLASFLPLACYRKGCLFKWLC